VLLYEAVAQRDPDGTRVVAPTDSQRPGARPAASTASPDAAPETDPTDAPETAVASASPETLDRTVPDTQDEKAALADAAATGEPAIQDPSSGDLLPGGPAIAEPSPPVKRSTPRKPRAPRA
jgi:hypothetical protein